MPTMRKTTLRLAVLASLSIASACASKAPTLQRFPPAADLAVEAKPTLSVDALTSEKALNDHDAAIEAWAERGWLAVGRICRWAVDMGLKGQTCTPKP